MIDFMIDGCAYKIDQPEQSVLRIYGRNADKHINKLILTKKEVAARGFGYSYAIILQKFVGRGRSGMLIYIDVQFVVETFKNEKQTY